MNTPNYFSIAIKILLGTATILLALNLACAKGGGVQVLAFFNQVPVNEVNLRENILSGVSLMQTMIKILAFLGIILFSYFIYKGVKHRDKSHLDPK